MSSEPLRYDRSYEVPEEDEAKTLAGLLEAFEKIEQTTLEHSGHAIRSVHAKNHGLLRADLRVLDGLPPTLAQGIFSRPGTWPVVTRLSTITGDVLDGSVSTPRGSKGLGGHPGTDLLGKTFFSQALILFGPYMVKVCIAPVAPALTALTDSPLNVNGKPDGLRDAVLEFFSHTPTEWELRVQFCTDLATMPIKHASVPWPEEISPHVTVARITAALQAAWSPARSAAVDDGTSVSPWHGVTAHRPIGSVMRVRKAAYVASARFRAEHNRRTISAPKYLEGFPA